MITNYSLNEIEVKNLEEFLKEVPKKHNDQSLEITFTIGSGIGVGVTARKGAYSKDITDYGSW